MGSQNNNSMSNPQSNFDFVKFQISVNWNPNQADIFKYQTRLLKKLTKLSESLNKLKYYDFTDSLSLIQSVILHNENGYIERQNYNQVISWAGKKAVIKLFYNTVSPICTININTDDTINNL